MALAVAPGAAGAPGAGEQERGQKAEGSSRRAGSSSKRQKAEAGRERTERNVAMEGQKEKGRMCREADNVLVGVARHRFHLQSSVTDSSLKISR